MSLYTCPKFKIRIDPSSKKTQAFNPITYWHDLTTHWSREDAF